MSVTRMMKTPCILIRREESGEDEFGNPTTTPVEVETRCAFQQRDRSETDDGGELSKARWNLWLPYGTEIDTGDAVQVRGFEYEVEGEPAIFDEGSRSMWHVAAVVKRTAGAGGDA